MPKAAIPLVIAKATHHQRGVGFSTALETRFVTHAKLRRFRTSGTRASRGLTEVEASPAMTACAVSELSLSISPSSVTSGFMVALLCRLCFGCFAAVRLWRVHRLVLQARDRDLARVRHPWIWVANSRQITGPRSYVQVIEHPII